MCRETPAVRPPAVSSWGHGCRDAPFDLPPRLSGRLQPGGEGRRRARRRRRRLARQPADRGLHLRQGAPLPRAHVRARAHPASGRARRAERAGAYRDVSWDEALGRITAALADARDRFGGESILPFCYGGSNGYLTQDALDARLFRRLGSSRLLRTVCAAPTGTAVAGLYGKMPGVALPDYEHARLIVIWGCNPTASGIHLGPPIQRARRAAPAWWSSIRARRGSRARLTCTSRCARARTCPSRCR